MNVYFNLSNNTIRNLFTDENYIMSADEKFLTDFNLKDIYEYPKHKELAYYIHTFVLDNKEEIFNEFLAE